MSFKTAYVVRPRLELIATLAKHDQDLSEYFNHPTLIIRESEPQDSGQVAHEQWLSEQMTAVKNRFVQHVLVDFSPDERDCHLALQNALGPFQMPSDAFDEWWTLERVEEILRFDGMEQAN